MTTLPSPETCLAYASILEKPYRNVAGGIMHEPGEVARAAAAALRLVAEDNPVEMWSDDRKLTIYRDIVLRVWGTNIDTEMSEEPRSLETVQAAFEWLASGPRDALALQVLTLTNERDESRARSAGCT